MTAFQRRWLSVLALQGMDRQIYEGVIASVSEERLHNKYAGTDGLQPVIHFDDGWLFVPSQDALVKLIHWFGGESQNWIGRRIEVGLRRVETKTGKARYLRTVSCPDPLARERPWDRPLDRSPWPQREDDEDGTLPN